MATSYDNVLTRTRQALITHLAANLPDGPWTVRSGKRTEGRVKDRKLAVVFCEGLVADSADVQVARPAIVIRAWLPLGRQPRTDVPRDPAPLEQLAVDLATTLQPVQTSLIDGVYLFALSFEIDDDPEEWGVEVRLTTWTDNPAVLA